MQHLCNRLKMKEIFHGKDTPKWLKNCVIYEVFTRNFANAGTFNDVYNDLESLNKSLRRYCLVNAFYPW